MNLKSKRKPQTNAKQVSRNRQRRSRLLQRRQLRLASRRRRRKSTNLTMMTIMSRATSEKRHLSNVVRRKGLRHRNRQPKYEKKKIYSLDLQLCSRFDCNFFFVTISEARASTKSNSIAKKWNKRRSRDCIDAQNNEGAGKTETR